MASILSIKSKYTVKKVENQKKQRCIGHRICRNVLATKTWIKYKLLEKNDKKLKKT